MGGYTYYKENNSENRGVNFLKTRPGDLFLRIQPKIQEINEKTEPGWKTLKNSAGGFP
jgi:hypothetical protein